MDHGIARRTEHDHDTVIADDSGASGLALEATSFRAILDGRPEVAMAMLATLAGRIGTA